jgi:hypothetical protein
LETSAQDTDQARGHETRVPAVHRIPTILAPSVLACAAVCACGSTSQRAGSQPSAAEVARYYRLHRQAYFVPERRAFEIDNLKSGSAVARVKREVEAGRSFASLSLREELSRTPGRAAGGRQIERAIFAARPGVLGGPVLLPAYGDHSLFEVTRIVPARYAPLAQVRGAIAAELAGKR